MDDEATAPPRPSRLASTLPALAGFALATLAALGLAASREATGRALVARAVLWAPPLAGLGLAGYGVGLVPVLLLRARVPRPFLAGLGTGLFWLVLALAGAPYDLGLKAPAGLFLVSVFLGVLVSGAAIGSSLAKGEIGGDA